MQDQDNSSLVPAPTTGDDIERFEVAILNYMGGLGLPTAAVFVGVPERVVVFQNVDAVIGLVDAQQLPNSVYISKFLAAAAAGLFDAALNYLWDQTIVELRRRVAHYDLAYFYDVAVSDPNKRKKLSDAADLDKVDDSELIRGAHEIELISDLGYRHLDFIRYMRNWASAAHPNQNEITGLQLITWLQTCIREVINLPLSNVVVEIKRLLANIKTNRISPDEANQIGMFFTELTQERVNTLGAGFFGIYTQVETTTQTRQNIQLLLQHIWDRVDEQTRLQFGVKYAQLLAKNEQQQQALARQFLVAVDGLSYAPDGILAAEIETAVDNLLVAHRGFDNFHNEPAFAFQLERVVGTAGNIPRQVNRKYVLALVEVFLTNGNGVAWNAEPIYVSLLEKLDSTQVLIATLSFMQSEVASKLQFRWCQEKFVELLNMMKQQTPNPAVRDLIEFIQAQTTPPDKLRSVTEVKRKVESLRRIVSM